MDRREYKQMMEQIRPAPELMERVLAEGQTFRMRLTFMSSTVTGVSATTLTFSTEPGAQA